MRVSEKKEERKRELGEERRKRENSIRCLLNGRQRVGNRNRSGKCGREVLRERERRDMCVSVCVLNTHSFSHIRWYGIFVKGAEM